jgi:hypothetical protein
MSPLLTGFPFAAGGAAVTAITEVRLTSGTSWTIPAGVKLITATWVGGGGGAASAGAAGGGGGEVKRQTFSGLTPGGTISYSIGAGGNPGSSGGSTTFNGVSAAAGATGVNGVGGASGNGNAGGTGTTSPRKGGGGGGAGGVGSAPAASAGGNGGIGSYGLGGGGAGNYDTSAFGIATATDGGAGTSNSPYNSFVNNANANTGGGAPGNGNAIATNGSQGGVGGSGVIVIQYPTY